MVKKKKSSVIAILLVIVMVLSLLPLNNLTLAFAASIEHFNIILRDSGNVTHLNDVNVTLTNKADETITSTVASVDGMAIFDNFVEEGATYKLSVASVHGYEDVADSEITVATGETEKDVNLVPISKVSVSGVITDENGQPYQGATINVSGYVTLNTTTNDEGKYSFETYAGKDNTIQITPKEEKYNSINTSSIYNSNKTDANYQLSVKTFDVTTVAGENGTITPSETGVLYNSNKDIQIVANKGYRIQEVRLNDDNVIAEALGKQSYTLNLSEIKENQRVTASFYRMTYKITFTVGANGEVTYGDGVSDKVEGGSVDVEKIFEESTDATPTRIAITAKPAQNYRVSKVTVDDIDSTFTDNNYIYQTELEMTKDHSFVVEFSINEYTVSLDPVTNGEASISTMDKTDNTSLQVKHGETIFVQAMPNDGYEINEIKVGDQVVEYQETINGYETSVDGISITSDAHVQVTFVEKQEVQDGSYTIDLPETSNTVNGVTYVNKNGNVVFTPDGGYSRVKINSNYTSESIEENNNKVTVKVGEESDGGVAKIESIEVSNKAAGGWSKKKELNITYDDEKPVISDVENEGKWFNKGTYKFTALDLKSGIKTVKYSEVNDESKAKEITPNAEGKYSFEVSKASAGNYYIWATDFCGNTTMKEVGVRVDTEKPLITKFTFTEVENDVKDDIINFLSFGIFCKQKIYVRVYVSDKAREDVVSSELAEVTLYKDGVEFKTKDIVNDNGKYYAVFELTNEEFGNGAEISASVKDNADNSSDIIKPSELDQDDKINSNVVQVVTENDKPQATITCDKDPDHVHKAENIEKNWYKDDVDLNINVQDSLVGIKSVVIKMNGIPLEETKLAENIVNTDFSSSKVTEKQYIVNTSQCSEAFEGKCTIEVIVTNNAGVTNTVAKDVYIDKTASNISRLEVVSTDNENNPLDAMLNFLTFGTFHNNNVNVIVVAKDKEESDKKEESNKKEVSGVKSITLFINNKEYKTLGVDEDNTVCFTLKRDELNEDGIIHANDLSVIATDYVGNSTAERFIPTTANSNIKNSSLMLENVAPKININHDNKLAYIDGNKEWYNSDVEFDVEPKDDNSGLRNAVVSINGKNLVNENFNTEKTKTNSMKYKVSTKDATIKKDGSYMIKSTAIDNAGNVSNEEVRTVYKDINEPYITQFDFTPEKYVEGDELKSTVEVTEYGFYFKENTTVTIHADDAAPSSGVKSITYYTVDYTDDEKGVKSKEETVDVVDNKIVVKIPANFKGQIYAKATDNVKNTSKSFVNPNSAIVENADKHEEEDHIKLDKIKSENTTNEGNELFNQNVNVDVTVIDTYSGIRSVEWSVVAPYDTENNQKGKVTINNDKTFAEGSDSGWKQTQTKVNLVTEMKKTITVNNDSNNIVLNVKMTDRAGNTSNKTIEFSIDKTAPVIKVEYDNNTPDETYTDIYKENRIALITVTERNLKESDIVYEIQNTDGVIPELSAWEEHKNDEDPNKTYYTATAVYSADGDYTFDIKCADLAKNSSNKIDTNKFTIDKTVPVLSVAYDNNSALNGNYYSMDRIATITIREHNFDASRVSVIGAATDDGTPSVFPTTSAWVNTGKDTYTATIAYTVDSKYSFDIEFKDKAGNSIVDYTPEEFILDKTEPNIEIGGVEDKSANNGDVIPFVTCSDTNFNKDNVSITLEGANNGLVNYDGSYQDIKNGETFTYENFEKVQKVDDIYTLTATVTDFAGKETSKSIVFSANRFGSVYDLTKVKNILNKYLQTEQDVVFKEVNVDSLNRKEIVLKLTKNGTPKTLKEGKDYQVKASGGNGKWSEYTYTINKNHFTEDGKYSVSVYSKDAAGNVNENINEKKKAEISFGIDKTNPVIVPIDLESGNQYPVQGKEAFVEIKDNLVLDNVSIYLNGEPVKYEVEGETYKFFIPESNSVQNAKIVAKDAAGNEYEVTIENFLVSTNLFARWYNNTPLFVGSIIGIIALVCGIILFILFGKRKKNEKEANA